LKEGLGGTFEPVKKEIAMGRFIGLPGVAGGVLEGDCAASVSGVLSCLKNARVSSAAGDYGAVTVWVDDEGAYRADFSRHRSSLDEQVFGTKAQLKAWLTEWFPKMHAA
jgi:hypothetical protein